MISTHRLDNQAGPAPGTRDHEPGAPHLSVGELARRTGLTPEVLRAWEARHGFPQPVRLASGHRRYPESTVDAIRQVQARQQRGMRLEGAIAEVGRMGVLGAGGAPSVFAALARGPEAPPARSLAKSTLVALSHAIEDEFCARASMPFMFGAFQTERHYDASSDRWEELSRTARAAMVFADFAGLAGGASAGTARPVRVALSARAPLRREWVVIGDAADLCVCLAGWEPPGQDHVPDRRRRFETVWTVEPRLVRRASGVCAALAVNADVEGARDLAADVESAPMAPPGRAAGWGPLFERFVVYLDRSA